MEFHFKPKTHLGSTEIRTRIAGFKVQSASHYTMEPLLLKLMVVKFQVPPRFELGLLDSESRVLANMIS
ncbi:hypothetical protein T4B_7623 [Trichinella pseudospiralis]|uniref:Uncharacterized protein n=1 Tax=Trichinella pseudospiralis TaxID=6337 RepID=A0A0V1JE34_TRIPS|nr:hypothetical protein T4B_7623 [Trichinella pseudospiralis]KRZ39590.1 hypothetical protein T4C_543 [Trichinella pseudospiralis]